MSGATLGWLAWRTDGAVALIAILPLFWALQRTRVMAALLWFGYFLAGSRDMAPVVARFFPDEPWALGVALWLLDAIILTLPWMVLWPRDEASPRAVSLRTAAAIVLFTVPPIGCLGWLSPLLASGVLYPGWSWLGIACVLALFVFLAIIGHALRTTRLASARRGMLLVAGLFVVAAGANVAYRPPQPPPGWVAINTQLGRFPTDRYEAFHRQQELMRLAEEAIEGGAKVVVLPEEVAGTWRTAVAYWWRPLDEFAVRHGATVLVGADVPVSPGLIEEVAPRLTNSLILLGATHGIINARQPIPMSLWRPWSDEAAIANLTGSGIVELHGMRIAVSICYEDLLAWPILVSFAHWPQPQILISAANNWFYDGLDPLWIQRRSVELWARVFGVPLLRALNTHG